MADHQLVETVLSWLAGWNSTNAPEPALVDRDDAESSSWNNRQITDDLDDQHVAGVASTPDRITTPIGTEYDHRVEDGVSVRIEGARGGDEWGTIADADEFQSIIDEAKRLVLAERTSYPTVNGVNYHTVVLENEQNLSTDHADYFRYDFDVIFRGFEELP